MTGYVRQSTADIIAGQDIKALPLSNEFNAIEAAFNSTTGHTHDGTTGNGVKISLTESVTGVLSSANGGTGRNLSIVAGDLIVGSGVGITTRLPIGTNTYVLTSNGTTTIWAPSVNIDTDPTLATNSDAKVASQKAVKTYVDGIIAATDAMVFKGVIDCSGNPNYPVADRGWTYRVSVAGKVGGASGINVEVGDILICLTDGTASGNQATVGANWTTIQVNIDGALTTANIGVTVQAFSSTLLAIATGGVANVQAFAASGTWTKPSIGSTVLVEIWSAGGGGGSGGRQAAGVNRIAGFGGGGGCYKFKFYRIADLSATETVTIGAGGTGGAAITTDTTVGNVGGQGGDTSFGTRITAYGGGGGPVTSGQGGGGGGVFSAGSGATGGAPLASTLGSTFGGASGSANNDGASSVYGGAAGGGFGGTTAYQGGTSTYGGSGGGSGGNLSSGNVAYSGGAGGGTGVSGGGGAGGTVNGGAGATAATAMFGGGGGGAGNPAGGAGGPGGSGSRGGGGGGGGGSLNGFISGAGGAGGNGYCVVTTI